MTLLIIVRNFLAMWGVPWHCGRLEWAIKVPQYSYMYIQKYSSMMDKKLIVVKCACRCSAKTRTSLYKSIFHGTVKCSMLIINNSCFLSGLLDSSF